MDIKFWENREKKIIKADLFSEQARKIAEEVFNEADSKKNKPTQLRKFYDEVLRFESILKSLSAEKQSEEFKKMLPYLMMLNSKVAYVEARDLVSKNFRDFIKKSLEEIKTKDDFDAFSGLFEAFMGFYKYYDEKGERPQRQIHTNRPQQGYGYRR